MAEMQVLSPNSIAHVRDKVHDVLEPKLDEVIVDLGALIPSYFEDKTKEYIQREGRRTLAELKFTSPYSYLSGVSGICIASASNRPDGADDLLVLIDPARNNVSFAGFSHSYDIGTMNDLME